MRENADWLTDEQISQADQVAKALREYQIPAYIVTSSDEQTLADIFARINAAGWRCRPSAPLGPPVRSGPGCGRMGG